MRTLAAFVLIASIAHAGANVNTESLAITDWPDTTGSFSSQDDHGNVYAQAGSTANSSSQFGSATAVTSGTASSLGMGAKADFAVELISNESESNGIAWASATGYDTHPDFPTGGNYAAASADRELEQSTLAVMRLAVVGSRSNDADLTNPSSFSQGVWMFASAGPWWVQASYWGEDIWLVEGELPDEDILYQTDALDGQFQFMLPSGEANFFAEVNLTDTGAYAAGDASLNYVFDAESFAVAEGDLDWDGDVDGADFLEWQRGMGAAITAVPEPTCLWLMLAILPSLTRFGH